jgi:hypothetical protein
MRKTCAECGGTGVIERPDGMMPRECQCSVLRRIASAMPAYVRYADLMHEHLKLPILREGIGKSYFIKATREDVYAMVKAAMMINSSKHIRMTSDRELRDIYVGSTSRKSRGDDAGEVINTLEEVMGPPALCIVQLGELVSRNKAASAILEEALCIRLDRDLPMWVVSYYDRPFGQGSISYSDSVWNILKNAMNELTIPRISKSHAPDAPSATNVLSPELVASQNSHSQRKETRTREPATQQQESSVERPRKRLQSTDPDPDLPKGFENFGKGTSSKKFSRRD